MSNSNPHTRAARSAFVFDNVRDASIRDIQIQWPEADRADRAGGLRSAYDWGELAMDRRKQESLDVEPAMHAFLFRGSSCIQIDAPFVTANRTSLVRLEGVNGTIRLDGKAISAEQGVGMPTYEGHS